MQAFKINQAEAVIPQQQIRVNSPAINIPRPEFNIGQTKVNASKAINLPQQIFNFGAQKVNIGAPQLSYLNKEINIAGQDIKVPQQTVKFSSSPFSHSAVTSTWKRLLLASASWTLARHLLLVLWAPRSRWTQPTCWSTSSPTKADSSE